MEVRKPVKRELFIIENPCLRLKTILEEHKKLNQFSNCSHFKDTISLPSKQLLNLVLTALSQPQNQERQIHAVILVLNTYVDVLAADKKLIELFARFFSEHFKYTIYFSSELAKLLKAKKIFEDHLSDSITLICNELDKACALKLVDKRPSDEDLEANVVYFYVKPSSWDHWFSRPKFAFVVKRGSIVSSCEEISVLNEYADNIKKAINNSNAQLDYAAEQGLFTLLENDYGFSFVAPYHGPTSYRLVNLCEILGSLKWVPSVNRDRIKFTLIRLMELGCGQMKSAVCKIIINLKPYFSETSLNELVKCLYDTLQKIQVNSSSAYLNICSALIALSEYLDKEQKENVKYHLLVIINKCYRDSHIQRAACDRLLSICETPCDDVVYELIAALAILQNNLEIKVKICQTLGRLNSHMSDDAKMQAIERLHNYLNNPNFRLEACLALCELNPHEILFVTIYGHLIDMLSVESNTEKAEAITITMAAFKKLEKYLSLEQKLMLSMQWMALLAFMKISHEKRRSTLSLYFAKLKKYLPPFPWLECADFFIKNLKSTNQLPASFYLCIVEMQDYIPEEKWKEIIELMLNKFHALFGAQTPGRDDYVNINATLCISLLQLKTRLIKTQGLQEFEELEKQILAWLLENKSNFLQSINPFSFEKWSQLLIECLTDLDLSDQKQQKQGVKNLEKCNFICENIPEGIDRGFVNEAVIKKIILLLQDCFLRYEVYAAQLCCSILFHLKSLITSEHEAFIIKTIFVFPEALKNKFLDIYTFGLTRIDSNIKALSHPDSLAGSDAARVLEEVNLATYSQKVLFLQKLMAHPSYETLDRFSEILLECIEADKTEIINHGLLRILPSEMLEHIHAHRP